MLIPEVRKIALQDKELKKLGPSAELYQEDSDDDFIVQSDEEDSYLSDDESQPSYPLRSGKRKAAVILERPTKKAKTSPFYIPQFIEKIFSDAKDPIIGRELEVQQIINMLSEKKNGIRPLLIGPHKIGKTSIVRKFAKTLQNRNVVTINCKALLAKNFLYGEEISYLLATAFKYTSEKNKKKPVYYFKDIDEILLIKDPTCHARQYIQSVLQNDFLCLASVSGHEKSKNVLKTIEQLSGHHFSPLYVSECTPNEAKEIAKIHIKQTPLINKIKLTTESLDLSIRLAASHIKSHAFPMKALYLLRQAAMQAFRNHPSSKTLKPIDIAEVVSREVKIPPQELIDPDFNNIKDLKTRFEKELVGQSYAIDKGIRAIERHRLGITDPSRPRFVGLLIGPTGVGKTEYVKQLVNLLHYHLIRIDMSEYKESHTISRLTGSPPGYVGYGDQGSLAKQLIRHPYSIVLLDEIEKAHPDVIQTFLQVFDDGRLTDGEGNTVDCKNAWFFMTSNLGAEEMLTLTTQRRVEIDTVIKKIEPYIHQHFKPEFINRITEIIPFQSLGVSDYPKVIDVHLTRLSIRLTKRHSAALSWNKSIYKYFIDNYMDHRFGARNMCRALEKEVGNAIALEAKNHSTINGAEIHLSVKKGNLTAGFKS